MEEWKDILEHEGLYQVSNYGRIRRFSDKFIMKTHIVNGGYESIRLNKNGQKTGGVIHKMVAMVFIDNPLNLPVINHKDENKLNNNVNNLEWCTQSYNLNYGGRNDKVSVKLRNNSITSKAVYQYDSAMNLLNEYPSLNECARQGFTSSAIHKCCNDKQNFHKGCIWKYKEDIING